MNNDLFKNLAKSTAKGGMILLIGTFVSRVIISLSSILIGRLLGPESYGLFNLALTPGRLLFIFTGFGITISLVRYLSISQEKKDYDMMRRVLLTSFSFQCIVSLILSLLLYVFAGEFAVIVINRPEAEPYIRITALWLFWFVIYTTVNNGFYGLGMMKNASILSTIQSILRLIIAPSLIVLGYGIMGAVVGHILSFIISGVLGIALLYTSIGIYREGSSGAKKLSWMEMPLLREMLILGFPAYFPSLVSNFMWVYRNYILSIFTTDLDIGNFSAAFYIFTAFAILMDPIHNTLLPSFSKIDLDKNAEVAVKLLGYSIRYSVLAIVPLVIFTMFFSKEVVVTLFGWKYVDASPYLALLLANYLYLGLGRVTLPSFFKGVGQTKILFETGLINLAISIPLYFILVEFFSTYGIMFTMLISGLVMILYQLKTVYKRFPEAFNLTGLFPIYLVSLLISLLLWLMRQRVQLGHTWGTLIFYLLLYLVILLTLLPVTRLVTENDLHNFEAAYRDFPIIGAIVEVIIRYERLVMKFSGNRK